MSFTISHQKILTSVAVLSTILLSACDKGTIKNNISSPSRFATAQSDHQYDSYYGLPPSNSSRAYQNGEANKVERTVRRVKGSTLKGDAPLRYKVRKGDTLWGIAKKFLKDPWFWPEVWDKNQRITNPHLIYPGDVLYIYQGSKQTHGKGTATITDKMKPTIRVERFNGTGEPISTLAPFLSWPRVLDEETIKNTPYIVDGQDYHLLLETEKTIYIKNFRGKPLERYAVFSKGKPMHDTDTGELIGHEVNYGSQAQIEKTGTISTAKLLNMKREVRIGDRLLNIENHEHLLTAPIQIPRQKIRGTVISLYDASMVSGTGMIITINKGKRDGIKLGHVLGVYQPSRKVVDPYPNSSKGYLSSNDRISLPPERAASAVVYSVTDRLSYALITKADHAVKNGYKIGNP